MKTPTTKPALRRLLLSQFSELELITQADFYQQLDISQSVEQSIRLACRFGLPIPAEKPTLTPRAALSVIGGLLEALEVAKTTDLLSVGEVGERLGISSRTVWRLVSSGELPAPIKIGGRTLWQSDSLQAMIELKR